MRRGRDRSWEVKPACAAVGLMRPVAHKCGHNYANCSASAVIISLLTPHQWSDSVIL